MRHFWLAVVIGFGCTPGGGGGGEGGSGGSTVDGGQNCVDTCPADGETECRNPGFRRCGDLDGDGCFEWGEVAACERACVMGQCADCTNECTPGSIQCGANGGVQTCITNGDEDPCFEFADERECAPGESCSAGECRPSAECVDECGVAGDVRCSGNGVQTCQTVPGDRCLHWSPARECAPGETCSLGSCRPANECVDECEAESARCRLNGFETCGNFDEDACVEWSAIVPCDEGEVCSNGQCSKTCADECNPEGARQCSGNGFQACGDFDGDECLEWGQVSPCDADEVCSGGSCRAACVNECAEGSAQCLGNGVQSCGDFDDDDCFEWSEAVLCDMGESCSGGECALQCVNECGVADARQCSGNGFQVCGNGDEDPCLEWGVVNACPAGQSCSGGECGERCVNECAEGSAQCAGDGVQRCGNFDEDECSEWSAAEPCGEGEGCSNGACAAVCGDECLNGASRCAPGGVQSCGNFDEDECTDWGPGAPCPEGQVCSNGECAARCSDECGVGARRCALGGFQTCGNFDEDDCQEWSSTQACDEGQVCSNGQCAQGCSDECPAGAAQCAGNGVQRCGNLDEDPCLEWSETLACPEGESCSSGACAPFCSDECVRGANRCGGGGVQTCDDFDEDACLEWSAGVPCPEGESCSNGRCAQVCEDECEAGAARCAEDGGAETCGNFDADDCREWSVAVACAQGQVCDDGACVVFDPVCDTDGDCPERFICQFDLCVPAVDCMGDEDCGPNETCDALNNVCRALEPSGVGDTCADDAGCNEGLSCFETADGPGYCTRSCNADEPCPTGASCYVLDDDSPDEGVCFRDCADRDQCDPAHACFPAGGALGGACFNAECDNDAACGNDPVLDLSCEAGRCVPSAPCDAATGEGCGPLPDGRGTECVQYEGFSVCLTPCEAFGEACPAGTQCIVDGGDGGFCQPTGGGAEFADCENHAACAAGLFCVPDGLGNQSCRRTCDSEGDDCGEGVTCTSLGGRLGVCAIDCESECAAGAVRCTDGGQQLCEQRDNDLCLEWGADSPCPAGQSCDELSGDCQPSCAGDADCGNALVPGRCVGGRCVIEGDCDPSTGEGCVDPEQCFLASADGEDGVCLQDCDPVEPECAAGGCGLFGGSGFCIELGAVAGGELCESSVECVSGACVSVPEGNARCFGPCDAEAADPEGAGCMGAEACTDLGVDGRLGVCLEPCEDVCAEGEVQCGPNGGVQSCGWGPDGLCRAWSAEEACEAGLNCNPESGACEDFCINDADCDEGDGVPRVCDVEAGECGLQPCAVGDNTCGAPDVERGRCVPSDPFNAPENGAGGFCLSNCDPLGEPDCGANGYCDFFPLSDMSVAFTCLPSGAQAEFERCGGGNGACGAGLTCIAAFDDGMGGTEEGCLRLCDRNDDQCGADSSCSEVGYFPAGVGVCTPDM